MKMQQRRRGLLCHLIILCVIAATACNKSTNAEKEISADVCLKNLKKIWRELLYTAETTAQFPTNFQVLEDTSIEPKFFVCPDTGTQPGSMTNVGEWTDFIYMGNQSVVVVRSALIISPPENHNGKYGYVCFVGGDAYRMPPSNIRQLINDPFSFATNTPLANIDYGRKHLVVNVPKRLQQFYPQN